MSTIHFEATRFEEAIRKTESPSAMGAVELLKSAFWVLSYPMPAQALMLFHQAIEVACKGLLQEVHVLLSAERLEYKLSKYVVRDRLAAHRLGRNVTTDFDIDGFDPARTCSFEDAWKRVREMVPALRSFTEVGLDRLTKLRNGITHRGAEQEKEFEYSGAILNVALPALDEFYKEAYDGLSLQDLIGQNLLRELHVAQSYLAMIETDETLPRERLLHTFRCEYQKDLIIGTANLLFDEDGVMLDLSDYRYNVNRKLYAEFDRRSQERGSLVGEGLFLFCKICGEIGIIVGIEDQAHIIDGKKAVDPCSLFCSSCGLNLPKTYSALAKLHYGPITEEAVGADEWKREISL
jgi:hypothetical protein